MSSVSTLGPSAVLTRGIQAAGIIAVVIGVIIAYRQLTKAHDWNCRKARHDVLSQLATGEMRDLRSTRETECGARFVEATQTYATVYVIVAADTAKAKYRFSVTTVLNYLETMAMGITNNVLEKNVCVDHYCEATAAFRRWAKPLVAEVRPDGPLTWIDLEGLVEQWNLRYSARLQAHRQAGRIPGRSPT